LTESQHCLASESNARVKNGTPSISPLPSRDGGVGGHKGGFGKGRGVNSWVDLDVAGYYIVSASSSKVCGALQTERDDIYEWFLEVISDVGRGSVGGVSMPSLSNLQFVVGLYSCVSMWQIGRCIGQPWQP